MYALHESGMAVSSLPSPGPVSPPPGQVEPRAVESTEHGTLETEDRGDVFYSPGTAVLQLVQDSAQGYAEMLASIDTLEAAATPSGAYLGDNVGQELDIYA